MLGTARLASASAESRQHPHSINTATAAPDGVRHDRALPIQHAATYILGAMPPRVACFFATIVHVFCIIARSSGACCHVSRQRVQCITPALFSGYFAWLGVCRVLNVHQLQSLEQTTRTKSHNFLPPHFKNGDEEKKSHHLQPQPQSSVAARAAGGCSGKLIKAVCGRGPSSSV